MIFVGDISIPYPGAVDTINFPRRLKELSWFGNLEGTPMENAPSLKTKRIVFNDKQAIRHLTEQFRFIGFALANNHILDTSSIEEILSFSSEINIPFVGIGNSIEQARKPLLLYENGIEIVILNFGWEVIQCQVSDKSNPGVNPFTKENALNTLLKSKEAYPNARIVVYVHWSYELECAPHPREREIAKLLIENGAEGVIGCHPHRIGGFELYRDKPIVYSLGNWMFKQNYYHNGKIRFPDFCERELAFEWNFEKNEMIFHFFEYSATTSTLTYLGMEKKGDEIMNRFTPFKGMSEVDYVQWYKKHRYHKRKGLPIYKYNDPDFLVTLKDTINKFRDFTISLITRFRSKK